MINVLVLEDDEALAALLRLLLEKYGCQAAFVNTGLQGIHYLASVDRLPNLILCDIFMPEMNGLKFVEHLKREPQWSKIPIVVMTSAPSDFYRYLSLSYGATAFLAKPFTYQGLTAMLEGVGIPPVRTH